MAKYGKTWWGAQWLSAIEKMDDSGRLSRGRALAGNGSVLSFELNNSLIEAKVQGSSLRPYKITIRVPAYSDKEKDILISTVQKSPLLMADLMNKTLPVGLLQEAEACGIKVFPKRWNDMTMECSCPDYALPCKHLAAVMYSLANKIDADPFLAFEMKGLDLKKSIATSDMGESSLESSIPVLQEWLGLPYTPKSPIAKGATKAKGKKTDAALSDDTQTGQPTVLQMKVADAKKLEMLDFSAIPPQGTRMLDLLKDAPVFCPEENFRTLLTSHYKQISKALTGGKLPPQHTLTDYLALQKRLTNCTDLYLNVGAELLLPQVNIVSEDTTEGISLMQLLPFMDVTDMTAIERMHPNMRVLVAVYYMAKRILATGLVVPQLFRSNDETVVLWTPKSNFKDLDPQLAVLAECTFGLVWRPSLNDFMPSELALQYLLTVILSHEIKRRSTDFLPRNVAQSTEKTISKSVYTGSYGYGGFAQKKSIQVKVKVEKTWGVPLLHLFFTDEHIADIPESVIESVHIWLSKLHIGKKDYVPVLQIEEDYPLFDMSLLVRNTTDKKDILPVPFDKFMAQKSNQPHFMGLLKTISLLQDTYADIQKLAVTSKAASISYKTSAFSDILIGVLPVLEILGVEMLLPKALKHLVRPAPSVRASYKGAKGSTPEGFMSLSGLISFDWQVALGEHVVTLAEFRQLLKQGAGLIKFRESFIQLSEADLSALLKQLEGDPNKKIGHPLHVVLAEEYQGAKIVIDDEVKSQIEALTKPVPVELPKGLQAQLRPYQARGYEWLYKNTKAGLGSILADDMGLGKTLQTITLLLKLKQENTTQGLPTLIVTPTTLLSNWSRELEKFAPELTYLVYHGPNRDLKQFTTQDLLLTSYGLVRSDADKFKKMSFRAIIIDEAQNIKNVSAEQTKAVKNVKADVRIALSGTPVENRLSEYWSIFDFTNHGWLGTPKYFDNTFAKPIQTDRDQVQLRAFRSVTAPFIMRRLKSDKSIISDLPDKVENNMYSSLLPAQVALYESVVNESLEALEEKDDGIQRQGLVLKMMTSLKQICNLPELYLKKNKPVSINDSGKLQLLVDLLSPIIENGEKSLIFTQYKEMGDHLQTQLAQEFGAKPLFLHGGLSRTERDSIVEKFTHNPQHKIFILSLKAGGTGLNLTQAQNVFHYDLWWNPAVEAQATDRAYRIGQKSNVQVYRFISKGTLEEKIDAMIRSKKELADLTVTTGENWIGDLSNSELRDLVKLSK